MVKYFKQADHFVRASWVQTCDQYLGEYELYEGNCEFDIQHPTSCWMRVYYTGSPVCPMWAEHDCWFTMVFEEMEDVSEWCPESGIWKIEATLEEHSFYWAGIEQEWVFNSELIDLPKKTGSYSLTHHEKLELPEQI